MRQEGLLPEKAGGQAPETPQFRFSNSYFPFFPWGFTLFELTVAIAIFVLAASGILSVFISSATLADSAGYITSITNRAREEMEDNILRSDFDSLNDYSLLPPNVPDGTSLACYVQNRNSTFCPDENNLKEVRIVISYREKSDRIIGEDRNLNGLLDAGEDINGDGRLSSPCEIVSFVARGI